MPQAPRIDIITVCNPLRKLQSMLENALVTPKKRAKKMKQSPEKAAEEVNPLVDEDVSMIPVYEVSDHYMNLKGGGAGDAPLPLKRKKVKDVILCRISTNDTKICKLFTGCPHSVFIIFYVFLYVSIFLCSIVFKIIFSMFSRFFKYF